MALSSIDRRRFLAVAGGTVLGCRSRGSRRDPGTLVLAVRADVTGLYPNPPFRNEAFTTRVNWNLFEGLVKLDRNLELQPALARHWENPDDRTYLFELRSDARFSDGRPVRVADAVASLREVKRTPFRDYFHAVSGVEAVDERRLAVSTSGTYLILLTRLPMAMVLPEAEWQKESAAAIGTGPYRLLSWEPGKRLLLERNPFYSGPVPAFERVVYEVIQGDAARGEAVLSGTVDAADGVPLEALDELKRDPTVQVVSRQGLRVLSLSLRPGRPPFDDPRVRLAVDLAIDRDELLTRALGGHGQVATQMVPPAVVGFEPSLPKPRADPERARALMAAAGHPRGFDLDLHGPNNRNLNDGAVLEELARQLLRVGIRARVRAMDKLAFFQLAARGGTQMHLMGWSCDTAEAGDLLDAMAHSKTGNGLGSDNDMDLEDPELDRLIQRSNASTLLLERNLRLREAMVRLHGLRVYLPLYVQPEILVLTRRVSWTPPRDGVLMPADVAPAS